MGVAAGVVVGRGGGGVARFEVPPDMGREAVAMGGELPAQRLPRLEILDGAVALPGLREVRRQRQVEDRAPARSAAARAVASAASAAGSGASAKSCRTRAMRGLDVASPSIPSRPVMAASA